MDEISDEDKDLDETKFKSEVRVIFDVDESRLLQFCSSVMSSSDQHFSKSQIETLEALVRDALLGNSNDELGPHLEVDRGLFDMDHTVDIKTFRISKMSFYSASE